MPSIHSRVPGAWPVAAAIALLLCRPTAALAGSGTTTPCDTPQATFAAIEQQWAHALVAADRTALDLYEAPGYVLVNPAGMTLTKAQADGELLNGHQHFDSLAISGVRAWCSGNLAVVTGHASTRENYLGNDTSGEFEFTDIFRRSGGHWLAVHAQLTRVAVPGG